MQPDYHRTGHSVSLLYAHLVFADLVPQADLQPPMFTDCEATLRQVCTVLGAELVEFNGETDHGQPARPIPTRTRHRHPGRRLKGATARRMRADHTGRCNRARMHGHFWTPSYLAVSAGGAPQSIIKHHIEQQARPL